jgi:predicted ATP-dependent endonuclease of OLD family
MKFSSLIFEEPEAHLHPVVQRVLARPAGELLIASVDDNP